MKKLIVMIAVALLALSSKSYAESLSFSRWSSKWTPVVEFSKPEGREKVMSLDKKRQQATRQIREKKRELKRALQREIQNGEGDLVEDLSRKLRALERIRTSA